MVRDSQRAACSVRSFVRFPSLAVLVFVLLGDVSEKPQEHRVVQDTPEHCSFLFFFLFFSHYVFFPLSLSSWSHSCSCFLSQPKRWQHLV